MRRANFWPARRFLKHDLSSPKKQDPSPVFVLSSFVTCRKVSLVFWYQWQKNMYHLLLDANFERACVGAGCLRTVWAHFSSLSLSR